MNSSNSGHMHWIEEVRLLANIAFPTVAIQFCMYFIYPQTSSVVGRNLGTEALAGLSLSSLTGNLTCLSIIMGVLTAADTLMPRAFAMKKYREIGELAVRAFVISVMVLVIPISLLGTTMDTIFNALGQDPTVADLATNWLRIYILGVPFVLLFRIVQRFLACQHIVWPMVCCSFVACFLVHPFILRLLVPALGFEGSGVAIVLTQMVQSILIVVYLRWRPSYKAETWPGLSCSAINEAFSPGPMTTFFALSAGGVLSMSEWFFWESICFLVGHMGVVPLCIHSIAYNLIPLLFMIPLGLSIGLSVRIGHVIGESVKKAQLLVAGCMGFTIMVALISATLMYRFQNTIIGVFSHDDEVVAGCRTIWLDLCVYVVVIFIFGVNSGIMRALGLQWKLAVAICSILWLIALPTIVHVAIRNDGGVQAIWKLLPIFYSILNLVLISIYVSADWQGISDSIKERKGGSDNSIIDETSALVQTIT